MCACVVNIHMYTIVYPLYKYCITAHKLMFLSARIILMKSVDHDINWIFYTILYTVSHTSVVCLFMTPVVG